MALKYVVTKEEYDKLEDNIKPFYKQGADGKWVLDAEEDSASAAKLKEFRENNIKLMNEAKTLKEQIDKYGDTNPEKLAEMKKKLQEIDDKKLIEAGKLDELVAQKTERMRIDFENQIKAQKKAYDDKVSELDKTNARLSEVLIDSEITKAVTAIGGVRKDAMQDIIARGKRIWRLEDGKPVPKDGDRILFSKDGKEQMSFDEWAQVLLETAPFLFESSSGGGANGGDKDKKKTGVNQALKDLPASERLTRIHGGDNASSIAK